MSEITVDKYYLKKAKDLTNMLFDKDFLNNELTRESIDWLEDFLGFTLQSEAQMSARAAVLVARLKK